MTADDRAMDAIYDEIVAHGARQLVSGNIKPDPYLIDAALDTRRGLSVIGFLDASAREHCIELLRTLADAEGGQYVYPLHDLHLTVLNLITTGHYRAADDSRLPAFAAATARALTGIAPIDIHYRGAVLAPDCVLLRGYAADQTLAQVRERLRQELHAAGLGELLDLRYRLQTAHSTIFRFRSPLRHPQRFAALVNSFAKLNFSCRFAELALVTHDWYLTAARRSSVGAYSLSTFAR